MGPPPPASSGSLLTPAFAPVITAALGYWIRGFEAGFTETTDRIDDLVSNVERILDAARDYWSRDAAAKTESDLALEGEIRGRLHALSVHIVELSPRLGRAAIKALEDKLTELRRLVTAGSFAELDRRAEGERIASTYRLGAELVALLRRASRRYRRGSVVGGAVLTAGACKRLMIRGGRRGPAYLSTIKRWAQRLPSAD